METNFVEAVCLYFSGGVVCFLNNQQTGSVCRVGEDKWGTWKAPSSARLRARELGSKSVDLVERPQVEGKGFEAEQAEAHPWARV